MGVAHRCVDLLVRTFDGSLPTAHPIVMPLEARGHIQEVRPRKVVGEITVRADSEVCARGQIVAVLMPETMHRFADVRPTE